MLRVLLCSMTALGLLVAGASAQGQKDKAADKGTTAEKGKGTTKEKHKQEAKITKVDPKKGTITVEMTDKNGKKTTKTFNLTEDIRYFDSTGRAAAVDVFQSGDEVLVIEAEGKLKELRKHKGGTGAKDKTQAK